MAFRKLNEDELELLTDKERVAYEKALARYIAREKFADRVEELGAAKIEKVEPTSRPVIKVPSVETINFEYDRKEITKPAPISIIELEVAPVEKIEIGEVNMPMIQTVAPLPVKQYESVTPECKVDVKIDVPEEVKLNYEATEVSITGLPSIGNIVKDWNIADVTEVGKEVSVLPKVDIPMLEIDGTKQFVVPKMESLGIEIEIPSVEQSFEVGEISLDKMVIPNVNIATVDVSKMEKQEMKEIGVPLVSIPTVDIKGFSFERDDVKVPSVSIPEAKLDFVNFEKKEKFTVADIEVAEIEMKKVDIPQTAIGGIPKINNWEVPAWDEVMKEYM